MSQQRAGGLTAVAAELTKSRGKLVTRQGVYMWWKRRAANGFPEKKLVPASNGRMKEAFSFDEVLAWYDEYMAAPRQGRKREAS